MGTWLYGLCRVDTIAACLRVIVLTLFLSLASFWVSSSSSRARARQQTNDFVIAYFILLLFYFLKQKYWRKIVIEVFLSYIRYAQ